MDPNDLLAQLQTAAAQVNCENLPISQQFMCVAQGWRVTIVENIPSIGLAVVVLLVAFFLDDRAQRAVERVVGLRSGQRELARLLGRLTRFGVLIFALIIVVSIFRLTSVVTTFVASLGIAGLVIAFALQDITKNFAAGVLLLILRPFRLDDRIKVKDFEGIVTDISLRATSLRTADGEEVLVPNADVYSSPITNFTRFPQRRYHVPLSVPARLPIESIRQQLEATLREIPGVERDPLPQVVVTGVDADTASLDARYWLPSRAPDTAQRTTLVIERLTTLVEQIKARAMSQEQP